VDLVVVGFLERAVYQTFFKSLNLCVKIGGALFLYLFSDLFRTSSNFHRSRHRNILDLDAIISAKECSIGGLLDLLEEFSDIPGPGVGRKELRCVIAY
jgi:hypothetical protein